MTTGERFSGEVGPQGPMSIVKRYKVPAPQHRKLGNQPNQTLLPETCSTVPFTQKAGGMPNVESFQEITLEHNRGRRRILRALSVLTVSTLVTTAAMNTETPLETRVAETIESTFYDVVGEAQ